MVEANIIDILLFSMVLITFWIIIGLTWQSFRRFFHSNYSYFDSSFIIAYFLEQFFLILLLEFIPNKIVLWVSTFALIVVTTASLHKFSMDSRDRELKEIYVIEKHIRQEGEDFNHMLLEENDELKEQIKKLSDYILRTNKKLKKQG